MSIRALAWAIQVNAGDPVAKLLLVLLADHHNDSTGQCNPSRNLLAARAECSLRTIDRKLEQLELAGLIQPEPRVRTNGSSASNHYHLLMPCPDANLSVSGRQSVGGGGDTLTPHGGDTVAPLEPGSRTVLSPRERTRALEQALVEACGMHDRLTATARRRITKAAGELAEVDADPDEIHKRAARYRRHDVYGGCALTPTALVAHWPELARRSVTAPPPPVFDGPGVKIDELTAEQNLARAAELLTRLKGA